MTEPTSIAANAINAHGIDLLQKIGKPGENALISPYSIQNALVMTYAGAEGDTRIEMAKVLHYPKEDAELHQSFAALQKAIGDVMKKSTVDAEQTKKRGGKKDPIALIVANRLFGQKRHDFRAPFLSLLNNNYGAPLEPADFANNSADATKQINDWVADQTRQRICNLIPDGALGELTRLVLVNTIYLKAPWEAEFRESETKPLPFHTGGGESVEVPTMTGRRYVSYSRRNGFSVLALPYYGEDIQFLVLLPDQLNGLAQLER
jgi:serpin B